ncbi:putative tail fiber protein [Yersinia phage fEV-1]|nr:putative tail fiber protein [Yersinia phage fEV-1]
MAKIDRYGGNLEAFASEAQGQERTVFGTETIDDTLTAQINALFKRGWGTVSATDSPTLQDFNAAMYTATQLLAYLHQVGIAEWNQNQLYYAGTSACLHQGRIWIAAVDEPTDEPTSASAQWESVLSPDDISSDATPETLAKRDAAGTFKVSEATDPAHPVRQQEFDAHLQDTDAHEAANLSYDPTASTLTATDVQGAIDETVQRVDDLEVVVYAEEAATVSWNMATDTWTGDPKATAAHKSMRRCVVDSAGVIQYYLDEFDSTLQEDGVTPANLDGTDGQVMVEIQPFYVRTNFEGQVATWSVSAVPLPGYVLHPAFEGGAVLKTYIGAYDAIVYDTSAGAYINGLNLENNTSRVNLGEDLLASVATGNFAMVGLTRGEFRTLAQNAGFQLYDFWQYQAVIMLFITEYGSWNSQAVLGHGNVDRSYPVSSNNQAQSPHEANGLSNIIGNGSGGINTADGAPWVSYRGIENIWGNCWQFVDGWNVNNYQSYVSNNEAVYADDTSAGYTAIGDTVPAGITNTAIKNWQYIENAFIVRQVGGGASTSAFVTDHFWSATGWRVAHVGGDAETALRGGLAALYLLTVSVVRYRGLGARLSKKLRA